MKHNPSNYVQEQFDWVLSRYADLENIPVKLKMSDLKKSTMRAVPSYKWSGWFQFDVEYRIEVSTYVRDDKNQKVSELPEEVLRGWFAHELGHVQDYQGRSLIQMAIFGLRYLFSTNFAREVEHQADVYAVSNGFYPEIKKTKLFLFREGHENTSYGRKMQKMYMSLKDLEICHQAYQAELEVK